MLLLLKSAEHNEYPRIVQLPEGMGVAEGTALVAECRDAAQAANEDEWAWGDIIERLSAYGITEPEWNYGPVWDF